MTETRPGQRAVAEQAAADYARYYGVPAEGVWFAPGRVNLIGEHTDYTGGFVLPFALSLGAAVAAGRRPDDDIAVWSGQEAAGVVAPLAGLSPGSPAGWAAYPLGVAWSLRTAGYRLGGTSIGIDSDVPMGAGLSSSAALGCAVGLALADLHGLTVPRPELASLASRAENDFAGAPTGIMDQSAALLCRAGHALLLDCRSGATSDVPFDPGAAGLALLVIDTAARHALSDGRYAARRRSCEDAARILGVASLRDLADDPDAVVTLADPVLQRRARHVVTENRRVLAAVSLLGRGALAEVGPLLIESHVSLRDDFEVSWPEADAAVDAAVSAGALGARMIGGGFGGSVIALLPVGQRAAVEAAISAVFSRDGWPPAQFFEAVPSQGARRIC